MAVPPPLPASAFAPSFRVYRYRVDGSVTDERGARVSMDRVLARPRPRRSRARLLVGALLAVACVTGASTWARPAEARALGQAATSAAEVAAHHAGEALRALRTALGDPR